MSSTRNDILLLFAPKFGQRLFVEANDDFIVLAHDQQGGCMDVRKVTARQIRTSTTGNNRLDSLSQPSGGYQCRRSTCARPEIADSQIVDGGLVLRPLSGRDQSRRQ